MTINKFEKKLLLLFNGKNSLQYEQIKNEISREDFDTAAWTLNNKRFVDALFNEQKQCVSVGINQNGKAYLKENPKARNSFLSDNWKWIITTVIAIITIIITILA